MLHDLKHKFHLYFDHAVSVTNQVMNSPKMPAAAATYGISVGIVEINNALQTLSVLVGLVVGGMSLWIMLEKRINDRKLRKLKEKESRLKIKSLENHIRKQSK